MVWLFAACAAVMAALLLGGAGLRHPMDSGSIYFPGATDKWCLVCILEPECRLYLVHGSASLGGSRVVWRSLFSISGQIKTEQKSCGDGGGAKCGCQHQSGLCRDGKCRPLEEHRDVLGSRARLLFLDFIWSKLMQHYLCRGWQAPNVGGSSSAPRSHHVR
jgi:hypothetical protein